MTSIRDQLINEAKQFVDGPLPIRTVCPVCLGGSQHEECQTIWEGDDGNIFTKCHRSTCEAGTYLVKGSLINVVPSMREPEPDSLESDGSVPYGLQVMAMAELSEAEWGRLGSKYRFPFSQYPDFLLNRYLKSYSTHQGLVLPMYDVEFETRGYILKPYNPDMPKSLTYKEPEYDGMSWYLCAGHQVNPSVVVVEDGLSALACMLRGYSAIALNGTVLNRGRINTIRRYKRTIHLCFDADATHKAIEYAIRYGQQCTIKVERLETDFKDMTDEGLGVKLDRMTGKTCG